MLQDWLEALLLVSFVKDILLALNDLHEGCIIFNQLKTVCVLYDVFSQIYIKLLSPFPFQNAT